MLPMNLNCLIIIVLLIVLGSNSDPVVDGVDGWSRLLDGSGEGAVGRIGRGTVSGRGGGINVGGTG